VAHRARAVYARDHGVLSPSDPTQEVTFVAGTQVAKTEIGNNFIGFIIDWAPGPAMMVLPTSNTGKRSSRTRLAKMIESTPRLREKISDSSRDKRTARAQGIPRRRAGDRRREQRGRAEVDAGALPVRGRGRRVSGRRRRPGPGRRARREAHRHVQREEDLPHLDADEKGPLEDLAALAASDQRRYFVPCPHCAHEQVLVWEQMRWETRKVWEIATPTGEIREVDAGTEGAKASATPASSLDVWYECALRSAHRRAPEDRDARARPLDRRAPGAAPARLPPVGAVFAARLVLVAPGVKSASRRTRIRPGPAAQDLDQHRRSPSRMPTAATRTSPTRHQAARRSRTR
jgi:hypothetical protein